MNDKIVNLADYVVRRTENRSTAISEARLEGIGLQGVQDEKAFAIGGGFVTVSKLYGDDPHSDLGRFIDLANEAVKLLAECKAELASEELFAADDNFMACRPIFEKMYFFRDISDAVGLISLKCLQASKAMVVTDAPDLPSVLIDAVTRLIHAPYMAFDEACNVSSEIEIAAGNSLVLPSYNEIVAELLG